MKELELMFAKERHEAIAESLRLEGRVTVSELAIRFEVSEDCIRKDLKALDDAGRCHRVYGGAILPDALAARDIHLRMDSNRKEKRRIAQKAFHEIKEGETIFLDVATTNLYLAELLSRSEKRCTLVSNMIDGLQTCAKNSAITVLGTGGEVDLELNGFVGALTLATLETFHFDKAFIGAVGLNAEDGKVSTYAVDDGMVKKCVLERSNSAYLMLDAKKLDAQGVYSYAELSDFKGIISDQNTAELKRLAKAAGVSLI